MSNFFYKYTDYSSFQKAFRDTQGEDVVVDILSTDESLKAPEVIEKKPIIRKDNRFSKESSFNKFFGPRKSLNRNFDMKDFSSWKNKNYRETEKQLGQDNENKVKFSFADFMAERSGNKTYNDADQNKSNEQKAINELPSEDPTYKRFSLNDYMRRLEEKTRVKSEARDNEDLIDSIGDITQDVMPDSTQDENFDENVSNISVEHIVDDDAFKGDRFSVDSSELDAMKSQLAEIKSKTEEINALIDQDSAVDDETAIDEPASDESADDEFAEVPTIDVDEANDFDDSSEQAKETEAQDDVLADESAQEGESTYDDGTDETANKSGVVVVETVGDLTSDDKSQEIINLIDKNEKERKEIEEKLKQAESDKKEAQESYENRLRELEESIKEKDKANEQQVLQEKIKHDNKLSEMRAVYESREAEIRRLEKESALKLKIGALLKKELKNNLSISNLEMNNKLLEITSQINQEKERAKANKPKKTTTRKRKSKRKIDSDIIGGIDFD